MGGQADTYYHLISTHFRTIMAAIVTRASNKLIGLATYLRPKAQTFWAYARVELAPPSPAEIPQITKEASAIVKAARTAAYKKTTVKDAFRNFLVCAEVACWSFVGECVGRWQLCGYNIDGGVYNEINIM